jgi:hypothetical protein
LARQFAIELHRQAVVAIFAVLQGKNETRIEEHDSGRHDQSLRPVNPSTSSELSPSPQDSAFRSAQSAKLDRGRFVLSSDPVATITTKSFFPTGTSGGTFRVT